MECQNCSLYLNEINELKIKLKKTQDKYDKLSDLVGVRFETSVELAEFDKDQKDIDFIFNKYYSLSDLLGGQKGLAKFVYNHILFTTGLPIYNIVDKIRENGVFKGKDGELVYDVRMKALTTMIYQSVKKKAIKISTDEDAFNNQDLFDMFQDVLYIVDDNTEFRRELIRILTEIM